MTFVTTALQERHYSQLQNHFFAEPLTNEKAAFMLFAKTVLEDGERIVFTSRRVFILNEDDTLSSSGAHITWENQRLIPLLKQAAREGLVVGIAHSHLNYPPEFSSQDYEGEAGLCELVQHRNGPNAELISLVFSSYGTQNGRVWRSSSGPENFNLFRVNGKNFLYQFADIKQISDPSLARQALAFGDALNQTLAAMNVTIVGCGGTGSAVAMLLARLGVKKFTLIDPDIVEESNLNRLHGSTMQDAINKNQKVDVVSRHIQQIATQVEVKKFFTSVVDPICRDVLKASDVVFGCTDDNLGRLLLNRLAYFYLIPLIDLGLAIEVSKEPPYKILALDGRVSVLIPEATCLVCRGVINPVLAREEHLKVVNPEEYDRQKLEAYVIGEGNPSPSVVTFTTEVATMAVNELIHRLQGYRGPDGSTSSRTRQFHRMHDLRTGDKPKDDCPICGDDFYWGIGDIDPFLDQIW